MAAKINKKQQGLIDEMTRRVNMVREFMNDWLLFNQILSAYPSPGVNKAQLENQFLKIKSKLAREHNVLKDAISIDYLIDSNTMQIVSGATNLETIYSQSEVAVKKLQGEWHRSFISINETLGQIEDKKARAESGEKISLDGSAVGIPTSGGMSGGAKKNMLIAVVVIAAIAGFLYSPFGETYIEMVKSLFE
ncbi:MAG: hypothetical protein VCD00_05050 [Candidatus Hydrogenedentota bacterium]